MRSVKRASVPPVQAAPRHRHDGKTQDNTYLPLHQTRGKLWCLVQLPLTDLSIHSLSATDSETFTGHKMQTYRNVLWLEGRTTSMTHHFRLLFFIGWLMWHFFTFTSCEANKRDENVDHVGIFTVHSDFQRSATRTRSLMVCQGAIPVVTPFWFSTQVTSSPWNMKQEPPDELCRLVWSVCAGRAHTAVYKTQAQKIVLDLSWATSHTVQYVFPVPEKLILYWFNI